MFRRDLIELLAQPRSVHDLARELGEKPADIEDDLRHLLISLKHSNEYRAVVTPLAAATVDSSFTMTGCPSPASVRSAGTPGSRPR